MAKKHKEMHNAEHSHISAKDKDSLNPKKVGVTLGILKGLCMAFLAILAMSTGWGFPLVNILSSVLLGYKSTLLGALVGLLWGFAGGFVAGYLFALLYNKVEGCNF